MPSRNAPFHLAVISGNTAEVLRLMEADPNTVNLPGNDDWTPLHFAIREGHPTVVRVLLEKGADPEREDSRFHCRPIHFAASSGDVEMLQLLLDRGAELECRNVFGFTPLLEAVVHNRIAAVKLLLQHGADIRMNQYPQAWGMDLSLEVKELLELAERQCLFRKIRYITRLREDEPGRADTCPIIQGRLALNLPEPTVTFAEGPPGVVAQQQGGQQATPTLPEPEQQAETAAVMSHVFTGLSRELFMELNNFFVSL